LYPLINPFNNELVFEVSSQNSGKAEAELFDASGKAVRKKAFDISSGITRLSLENTSKLTTGIYFLRVQSAGKFIQKSVLKTSN